MIFLVVICSIDLKGVAPSSVPFESSFSITDAVVSYWGTAERKIEPGAGNAYHYGNDRKRPIRKIFKEHIIQYVLALLRAIVSG